MLEHVLSLLYEQQGVRGDDLLRWSDYREVGELKGALAKHAETVFSTLRPHEQRAFPLVMRYLVTLSQGEEEVPSRRTVPYRARILTASWDKTKLWDTASGKLVASFAHQDGLYPALLTRDFV